MINNIKYAVPSSFFCASDFCIFRPQAGHSMAEELILFWQSGHIISDIIAPNNLRLI